MEDITCRVQTVKSRLVWCRALQRTQTRVDGGQKRAPPGHMLIPGRTPCTAYLRGDPMREVGGVGLLPALCRRRTACRRNVLRSRRNMTVSSLPGAVMARDIMGRSDVCGGDIFMVYATLHNNKVSEICCLDFKWFHSYMTDRTTRTQGVRDCWTNG